MTAADKIAEARALIEPLTGHTPAPWQVQWGSEECTYEVFRLHSRDTIEIVGQSHLDSNAALIAAAPALRDTVAALTGLADAQAQENAKLKAIIAAMDGAAPRADKTCDEPGITLSEAVQREWPQLRLSPTASPETAP